MIFFFLIFSFIKSQTSDSFVNHFDGHFAYLKTLDFSFKFKNKVYNVDLILISKQSRTSHKKKLELNSDEMFSMLFFLTFYSQKI